MTNEYNLPLSEDRIIREAERLRLTSISRSQAFQLERRGLHPKRIRLGNRSVDWSFNSIMNWIRSRTTVEAYKGAD
jgi:prophage regulatory protein